MSGQIGELHGESARIEGVTILVRSGKDREGDRDEVLSVKERGAGGPFWGRPA
jgi:hypothetical protein